ncbi:MAG: signal peptide peptidase SppA [Phycisphaerae bacterium]|nr:signal peptide peptidase SppA [Phycisphaerae bacterium]
MDFEQNDNLSHAAEPRPDVPISGFGVGAPAAQPPRRRSGWRIFWRIVLSLSILANVVLFVMLLGVVAVFATGQGGFLTEEVVREGPAKNKIAMITVQGIIHGQAAGDVYRQLKAARQDRRVKGLILRVNSPGGTISASDQIYKEIRKFRDEEKMPVIAFMQGVAASGGYYASVACEKIIAEPTVITGSIGVISSYFVVKGLLEEKLGVLPVIVKSGKKKDWPSSFRPPTEEELQYMQDKLISPALDRFVEVVAEGRAGSLTSEQVRDITVDAGIYGARDALDEKLIDQIGYLDEAIALVKSMAQIGEAQVVQYRKPFSLTEFLSYRKASLPKLDRNTLYELGTPQVMYLWSAH